MSAPKCKMQLHSNQTFGIDICWDFYFSISKSSKYLILLISHMIVRKGDSTNSKCEMAQVDDYTSPQSKVILFNSFVAYLLTYNTRVQILELHFYIDFTQRNMTRLPKQMQIKRSALCVRNNESHKCKNLAHAAKKHSHITSFGFIIFIAPYLQSLRILCLIGEFWRTRLACTITP